MRCKRRCLSISVSKKPHQILMGWSWYAIFNLSAAISDYRQSLQFQNLNEEKQNIQIEVVMWAEFHSFIPPHFLFLILTFLWNIFQVIRDGRRTKVSIFEIVVGDVLTLKIGDQVNVTLSLFRLIISSLYALQFS